MLGTLLTTLIVFSGDIYDYIQMKVFLSKNNISDEVRDNSSAYLNQSEDEYFVYVYDSKYCETCKAYSKKLMNFDSSKLYKIDIQTVGMNIAEDKLFVNYQYPSIFHIKEGTKYFTYNGSEYNIGELGTFPQLSKVEESEDKK